MIKKKQREYASAQEYITPFLKRYRRVFWFDAFLAFLHIPLLAYLLIEQPTQELMLQIHIGWKTSIIHISIAGVGMLANTLLLRDTSFSTILAYLKIIYTLTIRVFPIFVISKAVDAPFIEMIETLLPLLLILIAYQGFYGSCVFLYSKWKKQLKENSDNQNIEPIVPTPVEPGCAQSTQAHV